MSTSTNTSRARTIVTRVIPASLFALGLSAGLGSCSDGSGGACGPSNPCTQRGEACVNGSCLPQDLDTTSTDPAFAGGDFSGLALPFFRGQICLPAEVATGDAIPIQIKPCLHPCISYNTHRYKQHFLCNGSDCDAIMISWLENTEGAGCPADVFGPFAEAECQYPVTIDATLGPIVINDAPIAGDTPIEFPFLSNEDIVMFDQGDPSASDAFDAAEQYALNPERVINLSVQPNNTPAPADCSAEGACLCQKIGF